MTFHLTDYYLWLKALHVIAVIAWMSGMFYLPRLFVYHCETTPGAPDYQRFCVMERRLLKLITTPAMIVVWIAGLVLVWLGGWSDAGWLDVKLVLVLGLSGVHGVNVRFVREFANERNQRSARFFRLWNEVPTLFLIAIVILAVVKPF